MFLYSNLQYPIECKFNSIYNNYIQLKQKQDLERQKAKEEGREFHEYEIIPDWFLDFSAKEEPFWFRPVWAGYSEKFKYNGLLDVYIEHNNKYYSFKAIGKDYKNNTLTFQLHRRISYFYDIYEKTNDKFKIVDCFHSFHNFISNIEKILNQL